MSFKTILARLSVFAALTVAASSASALVITPADAECSGPGTGSDGAWIVAHCNQMSGLLLGYKTGGEEGPLKDSYTTTFASPGGGADGFSAGTIVYDGGSILDCSVECWLIVKDGDAMPGRYAFDLTGWNGTETITLSNFWLNAQGAISHIALYGGTTTSTSTSSSTSTSTGGTVAEPGTTGMALMGLALLAVGLRFRARRCHRS